MTGWRLYHDLRRRGVRFQARDSRLLVEPAVLLMDADREALRTHRAEVLALVEAEEIANRYVDAIHVGADLPVLATARRAELRRLLDAWELTNQPSRTVPGASGSGGRP